MFLTNLNTRASLYSPSQYTPLVTPFSRECFLRHYGGQLKTAVEKEAGGNKAVKDNNKANKK